MVVIGLVLVLAVAAWWLPGTDGSSGGEPPTAAATATSTARSTPRASTPTVRDPDSGLIWVDASALPSQARQTVQRIEDGGPYPYAKDGAVFGNFEGILPARRSGYYHEYTVPTPGSSDRGARRIVVGQPDRGSSAELYYTDDHYDSFRRIRP